MSSTYTNNSGVIYRLEEKDSTYTLLKYENNKFARLGSYTTSESREQAFSFLKSLFRLPSNLKEVGSAEIKNKENESGTKPQ